MLVQSEGGVSLHCTDEEPEEEKPRRGSQDDSPEAAAGCYGAGRPAHRCRPAPSLSAPLPAAPASPAEVPPRPGPARPGGGRGRPRAACGPRACQRLPPQPGRLTRNLGAAREGSALPHRPGVRPSCQHARARLEMSEPARVPKPLPRRLPLSR